MAHRRGWYGILLFFFLCTLVVLGSAQPVITGVSIPNELMKIGDVVTATISVQSDSVTVYTLDPSTIGGYSLSELEKENSETYTALFTINEGGDDYAADADIPVNVTLADGGLTDTWTISISQDNDPIDANRPTDPTLSSPSHTVNVWSNDDQVVIEASGASDSGSGVDGFEVAWNQLAIWSPTETKTDEESWLGETFTATGDGDWHVHVATVDNAGNWSSGTAMGPFRIDTTPPSVPANLSPDDGMVTNNATIPLTWDASTDTGGSGLRDTDTYYVRVLGDPGRNYYTANTFYTTTLAEGAFVWRVRARDNAGNNSEFTVDRSFIIDTTPPNDPILSSSSHVPGVPSNDVNVQIAATGASDPESNGVSSGVAGFETAWNQSEAWSPSETANRAADWTGDTFEATMDGAWWFHIATVDAAGNWTSTEHFGPFEIDTSPPTVNSVAVDTDPMYEGDLTQEVTVTFDEAMNPSVHPTITFGAGTFTPGAAGVWSGGDTVWTRTFTLPDNNEEISGVTVGVSGAQDAAGNPQEPHTPVALFDIDTIKPSVDSVAVDTDPMYEGDLTQEVTVTFDEAMNPSIHPTITFGAGTFTPGAAGVWSGGDTVWTRTFTLPDNNEEISGVTVGVSGAQDAAGNPQEPHTPVALFDIDTIKPSVDSVAVDTDPMYEGDLTQEVTVTFDEAMNPSVHPTITFGAGTFTPGAAGVWSGGDTVWTRTFTLPDNNEEISGVTVGVSGAQDAAGNPQEPHIPVALFDIDTIGPEIASITSTTADGYYNAGDINVTVLFSEPVILSGGTLQITLDTDPVRTVSIDPFGPSDTASATYAIVAGDNVCLLDATAVALAVGGSLQDEAGNEAVIALPPVTIAEGSSITVDTTVPVIAGLDLGDNTQHVDGGCSITIPYTAVVTDNCFIDAADVSVLVSVNVVASTGTWTFDAPPATVANVGGAPSDRVEIDGAFTVSDLRDAASVVVDVRITARDSAGNEADVVTDTVTVLDNTIPAISGLSLPGGVISVDPDTCTSTIGFSATVTDNCCISAGSVSVVVELVPGADTATLLSWSATTENAADQQADVTGSFTVGELTDSPVQVRVRINATDCNGNEATQAVAVATFADERAPMITWDVPLPATPQYVSSDTCEISFPVEATVWDACCIDVANVTIDIAVTNATLFHTVTATQIDPTTVLVAGEITVSALTGCPAELTIDINARDCSMNVASTLSDSVNVFDDTIPVINDLRFNTDDTHSAEQTDPYLVDECGLVIVYFSANVTDNCCVMPGNVDVEVTLPTNNAILEEIVIQRTATAQGRVDIEGYATVRCLDGPEMARVRVDIHAWDCCGNAADPVWTADDEGRVNDIIVPIPRDDPRQDMPEDESAIIDPLVKVRLDDLGTYRLVLRESTPVRIDVLANDADNLTHNAHHPFAPCVACGPCGGQTGCCAVLYLHEIVEPPKHGTATIEDEEGNCAGGTVIRYAPDRGYLGPDSFTYLIRDAVGNVSTETATVYLQTVAEVWIEDVFVIACAGETVEITVAAFDLFISPDQPELIPFMFYVIEAPEHGVLGGPLVDIAYLPPSVVTDPLFGIRQVPSLDFTESAEVLLTYTAPLGFEGVDRMRIGLSDPFGGEATAVVSVVVSVCESREPVVLDVRQGRTLSFIVPEAFAAIVEAGLEAVTLRSMEGEGAHPESIAAVWSVEIGRYVLVVDTGMLPLGRYELRVPLGTGSIATLTLEVGEGE